MLRLQSLAISLVVLAILAVPAAAGPIVDFSDLSVLDKVTSLGSATTYGGITASAFYFNTSTGTWDASTLIARSEGLNDSGLGVCSEPSGCNVGGTGGGDYNELSQLTYDEAILLKRPSNFSWTGLYVSSLDDNDVNDPESGTLYWGNTSNIATLLGGTGFDFAWPSFGSAVYGPLALPGSFDPDAQYVLFVPGGNLGDNNDYLVWGADLVPNAPPAPEPGSLLLMASGIAALACRRRSSRSR